MQFETIHPFLDGNGRLGRLLITLILCSEGMLKQPLLYLSLYFKTNRQAYYDHLQLVRDTGDWEEWIKFFLTGVIDTAQQATDTAQAIIKLFHDDRLSIEKSETSSSSILNIHHYFQRYPISNTAKIKKTCDISLPTVLRALTALENFGIIEEITGKGRHKIYIYKKYLAILNAGSDLIVY